MSYKVVIPARLASSRLPGKVLADLAGKPILAHVIASAQQSSADEVWVATDEAEVFEVAESFGANACMTRADHPSGSDRIREVADQLGWSDEQVIVNVQGDEPLLPKAVIGQLAEIMHADSQADWATMAAPIAQAQEYFDPNAVKVVRDAGGYAMYFSRAPIPWDRAHSPTRDLPQAIQALRHVGVYAYRAGALRRYCLSKQASIEQSECLEQLRALYDGMKIKVAVLDEAPPAGVDTPEDLERLRNRFENLS